MILKKLNKIHFKELPGQINTFDALEEDKGNSFIYFPACLPVVSVCQLI